MKCFKCVPITALSNLHHTESYGMNQRKETLYSTVPLRLQATLYNNLKRT